MEDTMNQEPKSATIAGVLGITLGSVGAHNWYLGENGKGIAHICLLSGGFLMEFIRNILLSTLKPSAVVDLEGLLVFLSWAVSLVIITNAAWGIIEGIMILSRGNKGLSERGYAILWQSQNFSLPSNSMDNLGQSSMTTNNITPTPQQGNNVGNLNNSMMDTNIMNNGSTMNNMNLPPQDSISNSNNINSSNNFMGNEGFNNNGLQQ